MCGPFGFWFASPSVIMYCMGSDMVFCLEAGVCSLLQMSQRSPQIILENVADLSRGLLILAPSMAVHIVPLLLYKSQKLGAAAQPTPWQTGLLYSTLERWKPYLDIYSNLKYLYQRFISLICHPCNEDWSWTGRSHYIGPHGACTEVARHLLIPKQLRSSPSTLQLSLRLRLQLQLRLWMPMD